MMQNSTGKQRQTSAQQEQQTHHMLHLAFWGITRKTMVLDIQERGYMLGRNLYNIHHITNLPRYLFMSQGTSRINSQNIQCSTFLESLQYKRYVCPHFQCLNHYCVIWFRHWHIRIWHLPPLKHIWWDMPRL